MRVTKLMKRALGIALVSAVAAASLNVSAAALTNVQSNVDTSAQTSAGSVSKNDVAKTLIAVADAQIDLCVQNAQNKADLLIAMGYSKDSGQIQKVCAGLQDQTQDIVTKTSLILDRLSVHYQFDYYYVTVGGNQVLIDPLMWVG